MHWLFLILVLYVAWCVGLYIVQDQLMFPLNLLEPALAEVAPGAEAIAIGPIEGGKQVRVEACYFPGGASAERPAPLLVFFHGNAETVDNCLFVARDWARRGFAVLLVEYRGYGRSYGTPNERHLVGDAVAFIERVAERPEVDASRIVLHGRSVGGGVAAQVAVRLSPTRPIAAVILQSTFSSVPRLAAKLLAPPFLIRNTFRTDRALAAYGGPVLILHGEDDEIIPVSHARRLHRLLKGSTLVELPGHHNDFPVDEAAYWGAIDRFLAEHGLAPARR
jgi:alpha-beta hydrolase superfamily lysophospholipase